MQWAGSSRNDVRGFPTAVRQAIGYELDLLQRGERPGDWKPMPSIGPGVAELRIHVDGEHRVLYVVGYAEAIYVLHAFVKKRSKTGRRDLELARKRLSEVNQWRARTRSG